MRAAHTGIRVSAVMVIEQGHRHDQRHLSPPIGSIPWDVGLRETWQVGEALAAFEWLEHRSDS